MNSISKCASVNSLWGLFSKCVNSLFSLFTRSVFTALFSCQGSLSSRGVENLGNTCVFSSLLQEFALCYDHYAGFFEGVLEKEGDESEEHFTLRKTLQGLLKAAVFKLQEEKVVSKKEVREILSTLIDLDCCDVIDAGRYFSRKVLGLYVYSYMDTKKLWHRMLCFLGKTEGIVELEGFLENTLLQKDGRILCRVASRDGSYYPEKVEENGRFFTLKLVYVLEKKHMRVFHRGEDLWTCYDDTRVEKFKEVPWKDVCMVIYDSQKEKA